MLQFLSLRPGPYTKAMHPSKLVLGWQPDVLSGVWWQECGRDFSLLRFASAVCVKLLFLSLKVISSVCIIAFIVLNHCFCLDLIYSSLLYSFHCLCIRPWQLSCIMAVFCLIITLSEIGQSPKRKKKSHFLLFSFWWLRYIKRIKLVWKLDNLVCNYKYFSTESYHVDGNIFLYI